MSQDFFSRLGKYYLLVAGVLRGEADVARVFPNPADRGSTRETIYATFLRQQFHQNVMYLSVGTCFRKTGPNQDSLMLL